MLFSVHTSYCIWQYRRWSSHKSTKARMTYFKWDICLTFQILGFLLGFIVSPVPEDILFFLNLFCFVLFFFFFALAWNFSKSVYFIYFYFFTVFCRFWSEQPSQWPWVWLWKLVPVCFRSCWFHFFPHNYFFLFCRFPFQFCFVPVTFYFCWILCIPAVSAHLIPFLCHLFVWTALPVLQYQIPGLLHNMGSSSSVRIEPPAAVWDTVCPSVSLWG